MSPLKSIASWLGSLSVSRKLTLIYLLDLTAVIYISGILIHEKYLAIDFARKEIVGVAYTESVRQVLMPVVRAGVGAGRLADHAPFMTHFEAQRRAHDAALKAQGDSQALWDAVQPMLTQVGQSQVGAVADTQTVSLVIARARTLITTVANHSNLILDPDLDSYYSMSLASLRFAELVEVLHQAALALAHKQQAPPAQQALASTQLLIVAGRLDAIYLGIQADYTQAYAAGSPAFKSRLLDTQLALAQQLQQFLVLLQRFAEQPVSAADVHLAQGRRLTTQEALNAAWFSIAQALDDLLHQRVDALFAKMWLHLGTALALLISILGLVYTVARLIANPLKKLASVADEVRRTGNYNLRAHWHSQDEIGHLVTTFNDMLAQLDRDRDARQELAASTRAAKAQAEMLEAIPIAMVVTAVPEHQVLHANAPAVPWLGGRSTDPWRHGLEPGVRARFFQRLYDHDRIDEFEVRWLAGHEPSWAVLSARRLSFQGCDALLTTFTPINVLKLMEQRLELWAKVFGCGSFRP